MFGSRKNAVNTSSSSEELKAQLARINERAGSPTAKENPLYAQYLEQRRGRVEQELTIVFYDTRNELDELRGKTA